MSSDNAFTLNAGEQAAVETTPLEVKHGLPREVVYCKKCVMSNQRPATSPEFNKKSTSDTPTSAFGEDGICDACKYNEYKKNIDWDDRKVQLGKLCDRFRRDDGRYDVVVPGSGGKDSIFVSHVLKKEFGMNPLTVTWAPHAYTAIGQVNMEAWQKVGHDNLLFTPDPNVHAYLTRLAFLNLVNPFQPFIIGQKMLAARIALQFGVPFVMYGENQAEAHNDLEAAKQSLMDVKHFTCESLDQEMYFGGVSTADLAESHNIQRKDLQPYLPIPRKDIEAAGIEVHFMSYYYHWSPQQNYYHAKDVSAFQSNPKGRSEGTYTRFSSLDDKIDGQHYFTMLVKFGQGRAMNDACRDIRDGYISREEGVMLVEKYDQEFPQEHFQYFLDYIGISEEEYWKVVNNARSPHLWKTTDGKWELRHPIR